MSCPMTSMSAEAQAWRREQMERSNDIEGLTPLDAQDHAFLEDLYAREMTDEARLESIHDYIRTRVADRSVLYAKAS